MNSDRNELFPVFLKLNQLKVLLVGAGPVGLEKLGAMLSNAPHATIQIIAMDVLPQISELIAQHPHVSIEQRAYCTEDMHGYDLAIIAVNNRQLSETIYGHAKKAGILANVADTPDLCDFYLGSIVQKGNLKIAISTNGKSPTMAKRLRQWFNEILPEQMDDLLENLYTYRKTIKASFEEKVKHLDDLTSSFVSKEKW
jgi:siroheme synthase-like protein